jgi:alpha-galactosidase/6-phospho-beta-glucosidase family protein
VAAHADAYWPLLEDLAGDMLRLCPKAVLSLLVNPTDVLAGSVERRSGIRSVGVCVEVPQLKEWLCHLLCAPAPEISLEHIGANHVGWVSRWTVADGDGKALFSAALDRVDGTDRWNPTFDWFAEVFRRTGYLRCSPYHVWPDQRRNGLDLRAGRERYFAALESPHGVEWRKALFEEAAAKGTMVPDLEPPDVHFERRSFIYIGTRRTFGALAFGLAGGSSEPVPLQCRNGAANPSLPEEAWLEVPTVVAEGRLEPQTVPVPPATVFGRTEEIIGERTEIAGRLARR